MSLADNPWNILIVNMNTSHKHASISVTNGVQSIRITRDHALGAYLRLSQH